MTLFTAAQNALIAVGVISLWRGLWVLSDEYIFPERPKLSAAVSALLGVALLLISDSIDREW